MMKVEYNIPFSSAVGVFTFPCFTHEQVKEINKEVKKNIIQKESQIDSAQNASKTGEFFAVSCTPLMELIHPWLYHCQQVNKKVFGYDIYWHFHLDTLNYNVYGTNGEYKWHIDASEKNTNAADTKLTCLLNLSEAPYEGRDFHTVGSDGPRNFTSGMGLVMTSLVAHKVTPVTKGERITLTYWAEGPSWR